ncbi:hypothetical protein QOT17_015756 [Balamuthia mandrillaris]
MPQLQQQWDILHLPTSTPAASAQRPGILVIRVDQAGFDHQFISMYHPQANRAVESHIKLTKSMLNSLKSDLGHCISKLKTPHKITSLTKVMLQIVYSFIYKKGLSPWRRTVNNFIHTYQQDITGNILPDKIPSSALKPVDPNNPFKDKHFEVEKVLDHDGPPSDHYKKRHKWH